MARDDGLGSWLLLVLGGRRCRPAQVSGRARAGQMKGRGDPARVRDRPRRRPPSACPGALAARTVGSSIDERRTKGGQGRQAGMRRGVRASIRSAAAASCPGLVAGRSGRRARRGITRRPSGVDRQAVWCAWRAVVTDRGGAAGGPCEALSPCLLHPRPTTHDLPLSLPPLALLSSLDVRLHVVRPTADDDDDGQQPRVHQRPGRRPARGPDAPLVAPLARARRIADARPSRLGGHYRSRRLALYALSLSLSLSLAR